MSELIRAFLTAHLHNTVFAGGLGLVVLNFIRYDYGSSLPYGLEAMFIAAGFLVYYALMRKQQSK